MFDILERKLIPATCSNARKPQTLRIPTKTNKYANIEAKVVKVNQDKTKDFLNNLGEEDENQEKIQMAFFEIKGERNVSK